MKKRADFVFVKGNIIAKSGFHQAKDFGCYSSPEFENMTENIKNGDLELTDHDFIMPYNFYYATGEVQAWGKYDNGGLSGILDPRKVISLFRDEICNLRKLNTLEVEDLLVDSLKRQLFIGTIGTMEFFHCYFSYSMILGNVKYFEKFCNKYSKKYKETETNKTLQDTFKFITRKILNTSNNHNLKTIKGFYRDIFDLELEDLSELKEYIFIRHRLVHQNGYPANDSDYIKVTSKDLDSLIYKVEKLINQIITSLDFDIEEWYLEM